MLPMDFRRTVKCDAPREIDILPAGPPGLSAESFPGLGTLLWAPAAANHANDLQHAGLSATKRQPDKDVGPSSSDLVLAANFTSGQQPKPARSMIATELASLPGAPSLLDFNGIRDSFDHSISSANHSYRGFASSAAILSGTLLSRWGEIPRQSELRLLAERYPNSDWTHASWRNNLLRSRIQLNNVASWGAQASGYPEASRLLRDVENRGLKHGFYSSLAGSVMNHCVDKIFFPDSKYGTASFLFDFVGVASIASMPGIPVPLKIAGILAGHFFARQYDNRHKILNKSEPELQMKFVRGVPSR